MGHSYGGLFAAWTLLTAPELFAGYVIVSPSLWYDQRSVFDVEAQRNQGRTQLPARVYLAVGAREGDSTRDMVGDLERFASILDDRRLEGLTLRAEVADGETHNSVFPRALSNGLRFVLRGR